MRRIRIDITWDPANVERLSIVGNRSRYLEDLFAHHLAELHSAVLKLRRFDWSTEALTLLASVLHELGDPLVKTVHHRFIEQAELMTPRQLGAFGMTPEGWIRLRQTIEEEPARAPVLWAIRIIAQEIGFKNDWVDEFIRISD